MANFNESSISGTEYDRCYEIRILNQLNQVPLIEFKEQRVSILSTGKIIPENKGIIQNVFDPMESIELRNPLTGELTGETISFGEVYSILYSAYIKASINASTSS